jgi:hypothetical protein
MTRARMVFFMIALRLRRAASTTSFRLDYSSVDLGRVPE